MLMSVMDICIEQERTELHAAQQSSSSHMLMLKTHVAANDLHGSSPRLHMFAKLG